MDTYTCTAESLPCSPETIINNIVNQLYPNTKENSPYIKKKIKSDSVSPSISHEVMGPDAMILVFSMLSFKPTFSLSFHFHQEAF